MNRRQPLLLLMMLPLVGVLTLAVGLVWYITAQRGEETVYRQIQNLSTQQINETKYKLQRQFDTLRRVNEHNAYLLSQGVVNRNDAQAVQKLFWSQAQLVKAAGYFLFGSIDGDFVDVGVPLTLQREIVTERISQAEFGDNLLRTFAIGNAGQQQELLSDPMPYPFQKEPWFSNAQDKRATFWTDVYTWESSTATPQAIAVSSPVWGSEGKLAGVVAVEYRLAQLNPLLRSAAHNADTLVLLLNDQNLLLAASTDAQTADLAKLYTHPEVARTLNRA